MVIRASFALVFSVGLKEGVAQRIVEPEVDLVSALFQKEPLILLVHSFKPLLYNKLNTLHQRTQIRDGPLLQGTGRQTDKVLGIHSDQIRKLFRGFILRFH